MKKIFIDLGYYTLFLILLIFMCSLFNLIGCNSTITNLLLFLFNISSFLYFGFKNGRDTVNKGYIAGLKVSLMFIGVLIIISLITMKSIFNVTTIVYYIILILTGILGGMIGINKKDSKEQ